MEMPGSGMQTMTGFPGEACKSQILHHDESTTPLGWIFDVSFIESRLVEAFAAVPGARWGPELTRAVLDPEILLLITQPLVI